MHRYSSLPQFFDQFLFVLSTLRNERDHSTLMALVKTNVLLADPVEKEYSTLVTPYAMKFVSQQLQHRKKVAIIHESGMYYRCTVYVCDVYL